MFQMYLFLLLCNYNSYVHTITKQAESNNVAQYKGGGEIDENKKNSNKNIIKTDGR